MTVLNLFKRLFGKLRSRPTLADSRLISEKANSGNADAQFALGVAYECGFLELEKDIQKAANCYSKAAEQGSSRAQCALADLYKDAFRDYTVAAKLYEKAASQGDLKATTALGDMYLEGLGLVQCYKKAIDCYQLAARGGYRFAYAKMAMIYYYGFGVPRSDYYAMKWAARFLACQLLISPILLFKHTSKSFRSSTRSI